MTDLTLTQLILVLLIFIWSGLLPLLLLVDNRPLVYLPIIAVHLLIFSSLIVWQNNRKRVATEEKKPSTVGWVYLKKSLKIMIIPKLIGYDLKK